MSEENTMTRDTKIIIVAIAMAAIVIIGINKANMRELLTELRAKIRELRGLLITGYSHTLQNMAKVSGSEAKPQ